MKKYTILEFVDSEKGMIIEGAIPLETSIRPEGFFITPEHEDSPDYPVYFVPMHRIRIIKHTSMEEVEFERLKNEGKRKEKVPVGYFAAEKEEV